MDAFRLVFDEQRELVGEVPPVSCGLCAAPAKGRLLEEGALAGSFGWECGCGALGIHAPLYDLDELYDELLAAWGLGVDSPEAEPLTPVGASGFLFATYVDGPKLLQQLFNRARAEGAQVAATEVQVVIETPGSAGLELTWDVLWARAPRRGE
ncbi:hypothetical protein OWM54_03380 [Myxococcus sp. MISCRS1]|uniref:hypothetical protein n=1 Tax=unclassified Myxococcus TaxID=2648731 RepID=UPI001CC0757E|nr:MULTISPECIES: hypothetical protein [unclassified Myxococcus]MBZ4400116.1 hypothetical protein [Myxococcus sp. AS-1-15]MCY0996171.1 hypothetical protein [Myxococcus sp. MISCRS1]